MHNCNPLPIRHLGYAILGALLLSSTALGQITLDETYRIFSVGADVTVTSYDTSQPGDLSAIVNATGGDQTYDFSGVSLDDTLQATQQWVPFSSDIPGSDNEAFATSNLVFKLTLPATDDTEEFTSYQFYRFEDDVLTSLGSSLSEDVDGDGTADEGLFTQVPGLTVVALPVTFGSMWTSDYETWASVEGLGSLRFSSSKDTTEVNGWGTLITPMGNFQALRFDSRSQITSAFGGFVTESRVLSFNTADGVSANITLDNEGNATTAGISFWDAEGGGSGTPLDEAPELTTGNAVTDAYPNPFTSNTSITYSVDRPQHVTLSLYNVVGQEVARLVDRSVAGGTFSVDWDAPGLPEGVYFVRLQTESGTSVRSLVKR